MSTFFTLYTNKNSFNFFKEQISQEVIHELFMSYAKHAVTTKGINEDEIQLIPNVKKFE